MYRFLIPGLLLFFLLAICLSIQSQAQDQNSSTQNVTEIEVPEPKVFTTRHEGTFGEVRQYYTVKAAETYLFNEKNQPYGSIWSVSYTLDEVQDKAERPVIFIFNGGPGSASVWLHMGLFGPVLVAVDSDANEDDGAAPFLLKQNNYGLLDLADLVFIDPVGTGYSISIGAGKDADFWGLREDARSIAQFIRQWITKNKRWNAPKYIAGESFGTTRAVAVTDQLEKDGQNLALNGLILISQALDYTGSTPVHDNIIAYITYLPTMAATAWYHDCAGKGEKLENFIDRARKFATDKYAPALLKGNQLTGKELSYIASGLSEFTGLDTTYILQANLRILTHRFRKELMRNKGLVVGRLDSRYAAGEDDVHAEGSTLGDVASNSISSAYSAAINHYLSNNLKVEMDRPYLISNRKLSQKWNWRPVPESARWEPSYVNVARKLGDALRRNSDLNVMVANGYYDFATPFFDAEYTFARHGILKDRVRMLYYEAGHMMYTHEPDLKKLTSDIRTFLSNSLH